MAKKKVGKRAKKVAKDKRQRHYLWLLPVGLLLISLLVNLHSQTNVLGASTTNTGFSFSKLFSPVTSLFSKNNTSQSTSTSTATAQTPLSQEKLLAMASNTYADGNVPLGDNKYTTSGAKKGYIYLCNVQKGQGGAQASVPWIHGTTWNINEKSAVAGAVSWKNATFSNTKNGTTRIISGNDLPINHTTGVYPVSSSDPAYQYDKNPNTITAQTFTNSLPVNPVYSATPNCMGGEVGIMLTGVTLFNGFDAELRDAVAHELQDSCGGHPQVSGQYHYHGLSSCIKDVTVSTVIGFALDGFPITGPKVADGKYLTTTNLDDCHGITSEITLDNKKTVMYHYVMTQDFPYSVSCFRGKPVSKQVIQGSNGGVNGRQPATGGQNMSRPQQGTMPSGAMQGGQRTPPQEALTACSGKSSGTSCQFTAPMGTITGTCQTPPQQTSLICVPSDASRLH